MPWPKRQWQAIAASTIRRHGRVEGERLLRRYKREAGGHALIEAARSTEKKKGAR